MKRIFLCLMVVLGLFLGQLAVVDNTYAKPAADATDGGGGGGATPAKTDGAKCGDHFMGLRAWYDGIPAICENKQPESEEEIRQMIWMIVLNIVTLVLQVVGYVAVGFVIWGGYLYMLARGDASKVASGKKTITNALIGLVICMTASLISGAIVDVASGAAADSNFFASIFNTAFLWAGIVCAIIIVIGGISYVTSTGDPQKVAKAKNTIMYAAIGLAITLLAAAIVNLVVGAVNNGA